MKSIQDELLLVKDVGVFVKFSKLKTFKNELTFLYSTVKLKSPRRINLSLRTGGFVNSSLKLSKTVPSFLLGVRRFV